MPCEDAQPGDYSGGAPFGVPVDGAGGAGLDTMQNQMHTKGILKNGNNENRNCNI